MARLEQVITNIVDIFLEYADDDDKKVKQLNKDELKRVLEKEIQHPELRVRDPKISVYMMRRSIHKDYPAT